MLGSSEWLEQNNLFTIYEPAWRIYAQLFRYCDPGVVAMGKEQWHNEDPIGLDRLYRFFYPMGFFEIAGHYLRKMP